MKTYDCEIFFDPESDELRYLPEGPYTCGEGSLSWVAIQHGPDSTHGSLNITNFGTRVNQNWPLPGRPGFAFPTNRDSTFVIGLDRHVVLFHLETGEIQELAGPIDADVSNTIINDGLVFENGLVFGAKDLSFAEKKAGLYLWRGDSGQLVTLRTDQICSNGKALLHRDSEIYLLDIDSPTKTVVRYPFDPRSGLQGDAEVVIDLTAGDVIPDGMILAPDGASVVVAMFNPGDAEFGEARQYRLADGQLEAVWRVPDSVQVTCPQLVRTEEGVRLILTTAAEGMDEERRAKYPHAGKLFIGATEFSEVAAQPRLELTRAN